MRLLFMSYVNTSSYNDPDRWLHRLRWYLGVLEALSKKHLVTSIEQINYTGEKEVNGVHYCFYNNRQKKTHFPYRLHKIVKASKPDVIIVHGLSYPLQILQLRLAVGRSCKIIAQSHADKLPRGYRRLLQMLTDKFIYAYFFTSTDQATEWLEAKLIRGKQKIKEVMVGSSVFSAAEKAEARKGLGLKEEQIFLWVGRLDENKDPLTLIKAFSAYAQANVHTSLYLIYQSEELLAEVQRLLSQSRADAIKLIGKVSHDDMGLWYSSADYIVSSSHKEAFGVSVVEGMSCGCIPIVTGIPSLKKITGGICGLLYEAGNPNDLLRVLNQTVELNLENEREKTVAHFHQCLSFDAIANEIDKIIQAL